MKSVTLPKGSEICRLYVVKHPAGDVLPVKCKSALDEALENEALYVRGINKEELIHYNEIVNMKGALNRRGRDAVKDVIDIFETYGVKAQEVEALRAVI